MSEWLIAYLREQLREEPDNPHLKRLIKLERRRIEARGTRSYPPARTLDRARERLLTDGLIQPGSSGPYEASLPIDFEVRSLLRDGIIKDHSEEDAHWAGRLAVIDGCSWADYYSRLKLGREPGRKAAAKLALEDARLIQGQLNEFLYSHADALASGRFAAKNVSHQEQVATLRQAQEAIETIIQSARVAASDKGGRPGDPWRIGFVFGISHRWVSLTPFKISDSDRFLTFVSQGAASVEHAPRANSDNWSSAIRTAIASFRLSEDGRNWQEQPG